MKLNFKNAGFVFRDQQDVEYQVIFTPCPTPEGRTGKHYSAQCWKDGQPIGVFTTSFQVNKTNALELIGKAISSPINQNS